jgi:predicted secreted protein
MRPITQADTGKTFRLARGDEATLRLSNRWLWTTPRTRSSAVELIPVEYFVDPGFREWRVEAHARGKAIVRATGKPNCSVCTRGARTFRITIVVSAD